VQPWLKLQAPAEGRSHDVVLPKKILNRSRTSLQSIRDMIGRQAVPDSAFEFIRSARSSEEFRFGKNPTP
jgi:hypothetical protein